MNEARPTLALSLPCQWVKSPMGAGGFFLPRAPLSQRSFNQAINLGDHGCAFLSADGAIIGNAVLSKTGKGISIDLIAPQEAAKQVAGDVELLYSPIREVRKHGELVEYCEIRLRAIRLMGGRLEASAPSTAAPLSAQVAVRIDEVALSEALSEIRSSSFHSTSWVYFIKPTSYDFLKIGVSKDPEGRLKQFSTAAFDSLSLLAKVPGSRRLEHALHRIFAARRFNLEWFKYDRTLQALVDAVSAPNSSDVIARG